MLDGERGKVLQLGTFKQKGGAKQKWQGTRWMKRKDEDGGSGLVVQFEVVLEGCLWVAFLATETREDWEEPLHRANNI